MSASASSRSAPGSSKLSTADLDRFTQEAETKLSNGSVIKSLEKQFPDFQTNPEVREKIKKRFIADAARKASSGTDGGSKKKSRRSKSNKTSSPDDTATSSSTVPSTSPKSSTVKSNDYIPEEDSLRHIAVGRKKRQTGIPLSQRGSVRLAGGWSPAGTTTTAKDTDGNEYTMTVRSVPSDSYPGSNASPSLPRIQSGSFSFPGDNNPRSYARTATVDRNGFPFSISPLDADLYPTGFGSSTGATDTWQAGLPHTFGTQNDMPSFLSMQHDPSAGGSLWDPPTTGRPYGMHDPGDTMMGMGMGGSEFLGGNLLTGGGLDQNFRNATQTGGYSLNGGNTGMPRTVWVPASMG